MTHKNKVFALLVVLAGCTHASVSQIPYEVDGVGLVYRYQGRANFAHQIEKADQLMVEHCRKLGQGAPVIVNSRLQDLGIVALGSATQNTTYNANVAGTGHAGYVQGTANNVTSINSSGLRNMNQEVFFTCR